MSTKTRQMKALNKKVLKNNKLMKIRAIKKAAVTSFFSFPIINKSKFLITSKFNEIKFIAEESAVGAVKLFKTLTYRLKEFKLMENANFNANKNEDEMEMIHPIVKN